MKLIDENGTLQHVDNSSDVIEHYGKKGMKWGVKKAIDYGRAAYNNARHPIHSTRASMEALVKSPVGSNLATKRSLDYRNKRVSELVKAKAAMKDSNRKYKKERKAIDEKYSRREDKIARLENENAASHLKERGRLDANYKKNSPKNRYANVKKNGRTK